MVTDSTSESSGVTRLATMAERAWQYRLRREPYLQARRGIQVSRIPTGDLAEAEDDARFARGILRELDDIRSASIPHDDELTLEFLRAELEQTARGPDDWWTQFPVTPYAVFGVAGYLRKVFEPFNFVEDDAADRYVSLLGDYARLVDGLCVKLKAQAERGWLVPKPALPGVRATLRGLLTTAMSVLPVTPGRLEPLGQRASRCRQAIDVLVSGAVKPAFERVLEYLGEDYEGRAPEAVGLAQYSGGETAYRNLVRRHATFAADPEHVHAIGLEAVAQLSEEMRALRAAIGFLGTELEFTDHLRTTGRLYAKSPAEVERRYRHHMERMAAVVPRYFRSVPVAPYDVVRLEPAMEAGMSYGYYESPTAANPVGRYRYNGSGLESRSQLSVAALIFHELVPGHHFHLARQAENTRLPAIRREAVGITAFNEGWAEYASDLAREMNLYDDPYDLYGRLVLDRFAAQRLVVDTGLNLLGWPLERARSYMKANTLESATQIASETLRYSTDLPGQALTYRLGFLKFREVRRRAQDALRGRFDLGVFHDAVLDAGALPLAVLDRHVDWFIAEAHAIPDRGG